MASSGMPGIELNSEPAIRLKAEPKLSNSWPTSTDGSLGRVPAATVAFSAFSMTEVASCATAPTLTSSFSIAQVQVPTTSSWLVGLRRSPTSSSRTFWKSTSER